MNSKWKEIDFLENKDNPAIGMLSYSINNNNNKIKKHI